MILNTRYTAFCRLRMCLPTRVRRRTPEKTDSMAFESAGAASAPRESLAEIGGGSGSERVWKLLWRQSGVLRVERREPLLNPSGKIHHLHLERRPEASRPADSGADLQS